MIDQTNGKLKMLMEHSVKTGQEDSLMGELVKVLRHEDNGNKTVYLIPDFANLSLGFVVKDNVVNRITLQGGIIYHGKQGESIEDNFTTTIEPTSGWSVHT